MSISRLLGIHVSWIYMYEIYEEETYVKACVKNEVPVNFQLT